MDHQYRENGARNIYYVVCSPNQQNFEDSGIFLAVSVYLFYQNIAVQL